MLLAGSTRRALAPALAAIALLACRGPEPVGPDAAAGHVALDGRLAIDATVQEPGVGARDSLVFRVTLRNRTATPITLYTSACPVSVRLLAAAPGEGASATFYDDFQRPCIRLLQQVEVPPLGNTVLRHPVAVKDVSPAAPAELQAQVGVALDADVIMLRIGRFRIR